MDLDVWNDSCPYCGEAVELFVDSHEGDSSYIEDCWVCCRPISIFVSIAESGELSVRLCHENEC